MVRSASETGDVTVDGDPVEGVLELLREKGGRVTTSRRVLLSCLFESGPHHTAEELAQEVQRIAPDVHLSTIYRNLDELERLGVIIHSHLGHGPATYHLATETHGHLVCEVCDGQMEAPEEFFRDLTTAAKQQYGFVVDPRHFAVLGRCARLRGRKALIASDAASSSAISRLDATQRYASSKISSSSSKSTCPSRRTPSQPRDPT